MDHDISQPAQIKSKESLLPTTIGLSQSSPVQRYAYILIDSDSEDENSADNLNLDDSIDSGGVNSEKTDSGNSDSGNSQSGLNYSSQYKGEMRQHRIHVKLYKRSLWRSFVEIGNEMITTKSGR